MRANAGVLLTLLFSAALMCCGACLFPTSSAYVLYGSFLLGTFPALLLAREESGHWTAYARTLPLNRVQIVTEKYLLGLLAAVVSVGMTLCVLFCSQARGHDLPAGAGALFLAQAAFCAIAGSAVLLPLWYRFGTQKVLVTVLSVTGVLAAGYILYCKRDGYLGSYASLRVETDALSAPLLILQTLGVGAAMYAVSWGVSVVWDDK